MRLRLRMTVAHEFSPEQLAEARDYGRWRLGLKLAGYLVAISYWGVLALAVDPDLEVYLPRNRTGLLAQFNIIFLATMAGALAVSFPLSLASEYWLEHRFRLSHQTFGGWLQFYLKRNLLLVGFAEVTYAAMFLAIWNTGPWWWLTAAGVVTAIQLSGLLTPVANFRMLYKVEPLDDPALVARLASLTEGTGCRVNRVFRLKLSAATAKVNALMTGLGRARAVLLSDRLLEEFTPEEIDVIFAHELGHVAHRHLPKIVLGTVLVNLASLWLCQRALVAWTEHFYGYVHYEQLSPSSLPLLMLVMMLCMLSLTPLHNIARRRYERQSDRYAIARTGSAAAFVSAFTKLAKLNKENPHKHPLDVLLFDMHPPIGERLAAAENFL